MFLDVDQTWRADGIVERPGDRGGKLLYLSTNRFQHIARRLGRAFFCDTSSIPSAKFKTLAGICCIISRKPKPAAVRIDDFSAFITKQFAARFQIGFSVWIARSLAKLRTYLRSLSEIASPVIILRANARRMELETLQDLYFHELKDLYSSAKRGLPRP